MSQEILNNLIELLSSEDPSFQNQGLELWLSSSEDVRNAVLTITKVESSRIHYTGLEELSAQSDFLALYLYAENFEELGNTPDWERLTHLVVGTDLSSNTGGCWYVSSRLPSNIGLIQSLKYIDIANTKVDHLPESIGQLSNLREFYFHNSGITQLEQIPESIRAMDVQIWSIEDSSETQPCISELYTYWHDDYLYDLNRSGDFLEMMVEQELKHPYLSIIFTHNDVIATENGGGGTAWVLVSLKKLNGEIQGLMKFEGYAEFGPYSDYGSDGSGQLEFLGFVLNDFDTEIIQTLQNAVPDLPWDFAQHLRQRPDALIPKITESFGSPASSLPILSQYAKEKTKQQVLEALNGMEARIKELRTEWEQW